MKSTGAALLMSAMLSVPAVAAEDQGPGWSWALTPYLWATTVDTKLKGTALASDPSGSADFNDILDNLDVAFLMHAEGQGDRFGVFADLIYLGLGQTNTREHVSTNSDLDTTVFELAGVWSPSPGRFNGFDLFAGLRYIDVELEVDVTPLNPALSGGRINPSKSYSDFMFGARYQGAMSERWGYSLRGDASFGDTDGSWSASAYLNYKLASGKGAVVFGYRYLDVQFEAGEGDLDLTMYGPAVGYTFLF